MDIFVSWYTILDVVAKVSFVVVWISTLMVFVIFVGKAVIDGIKEEDDDE